MTIVFTYLKAAATRKVINLPVLGKKKNIIKQHRLELQRGRLSLYISKTKNKKSEALPMETEISITEDI